MEETEDRSLNDELRITDDLLKLLDDFRNNPYTAKEMEVRFDEWRRRAGTAAHIAAATAKAANVKSTKDKVRYGDMM